MPETPATREAMLVKLLDLMEKSAELRILPPERIRQIKEKYLRATDERIAAGIKMLEANAKNILHKNIEVKKKIKIEELKEKHDADLHAANLLESLAGLDKKPKKSHKGWVFFFLILICIAIFVLYRAHFILR